MKPETLGAITAAVSAVVAIVAAISAKRSADRSTEAEERSAKAAEDAVEIERQRLAHELEDRAESNAPRIDVGEKHGLRWVLAQHGSALVGFIVNHGPSAAIVESIELSGSENPVGVVGVDGSWDGLLGVGDTQQVEGPWPFADMPTEPLVITVIYAAASGSGYRARAAFTLRRDAADSNGQPLWRTGGSQVHRL